MVIDYYNLHCRKLESDFDSNSEWLRDYYEEFSKAKLVRNTIEISLFELAKRLKLSRNVIIESLREAGFVLSGNRDIILTSIHLDAILPKYIWSIKNSFRRLRKDQHILPTQEFNLYENFFDQFVYNNNFQVSNGCLDYELDNELISEFFYYVVSADYSSGQSYFNKIYYRLKIVIRKSYCDIRRLLFSLIVSNHYHLFSGDEDHRMRANSNLLLFCDRNIREAKIKINIYLMLFKWKKTYNYL